MRMRLPIAGLAVLIATISWLPVTVRAMEPHVDCRSPFVFDGADVNVVVLPYLSAGGSSMKVDQIGQRLALLVKLDVFSHILDYGRVGAVQLEVPEEAGNNASCTPEVVIPQLLGQLPGAETAVAKGRGVVFVWGILYEDKNDIIVQTYARFLRRDTNETMTVKAGGLQFSAKPTITTVAFSPRPFNRERLRAVEESYAKADFVRTEPRDDAPGEPLPRRVAKCFGCGDTAASTAFWVEEKKGEWLHVRWVDPQSRATRNGWIHGGGGLAGQSLDSILPESLFIQGAVGYLMQRIVDARGQKLPSTLADLTKRNLASFLKGSDAPGARSAAAVAWQMSGIVELLQGGAESVARARADFDAAIAATPYDANSITLGAVGQIAAEWDQRHSLSNTELLAGRLTAAGTLSDDPPAAIGNLRNFYKLLQAGAAAGTAQALSPAVVTERLAEIDRIRVQAGGMQN